MIELVHAELEFNLAAGDAVRAEDYFARFPQLTENDEDAIGIILAEFNLRSQREPGVSWDDLIARFPVYREQLVEHSTVGRFRLFAPLVKVTSASSGRPRICS